MDFGDIALQSEAAFTPEVFNAVTSRNATTASGTQAITGVGFRPSYVVIRCAINASAKVCFGSDDGVISQCVLNSVDGVAGTWSQTSRVIQVMDSGGDFNFAIITSFDSDGFTLTWTRTGSPTGTIQIQFSAFR